MLKFVEPQSWPAFLSFDVIDHVKYASDKLGFSDRRRLAKRAGEEFAYRVSQLPPPNGEEYVHVVALGCLEAYGPNRKGDAFPEEVCRKYHRTFQKYARWYRNHRHRDPARSYGVVKLSSYNEKMRRIDLIVALNATKEAAARNGGLIADKELDLLFNGESLPVSMACRVSYDICSGCGNRARTTWQYCDSRRCIKYGGCSKNLGRAFDDGHILHVINPDPLFFDISYVVVPADRIAYTLGVLKPNLWNNAKVAEDIPIESFYRRFDEAEMPAWLSETCSNPLIAAKIRLLDQLVEKEKQASLDQTQLWRAFCRPYLPNELPKLPLSELLGYLNKQGCIMPPQAFVRWVLPVTRPDLPELDSLETSAAFSILRQSVDLDARLDDNPYAFVECKTASAERELEYLKPYWGIQSDYVQRRLARNYINYPSLIPENTKTAQFNREAIKEYALYQLEAIFANCYNGSDLIVYANKSWNI